jgi:hypothetical protein
MKAGTLHALSSVRPTSLCGLLWYCPETAKRFAKEASAVSCGSCRGRLAEGRAFNGHPRRLVKPEASR